MSKIIGLCLFVTIICGQSNFINMSALICEEYPKLISFSYSANGPTLSEEIEFRLIVSQSITFCKQTMSNFYNVDPKHPKQALLVERGNCKESLKVANAQYLKDIDLVIIFDSLEQVSVSNDESIKYNIPVVQVSRQDGLAMLKYYRKRQCLNTKITLNALKQDITILNVLPQIYFHIDMNHGFSYFRQFYHHPIFGLMLPHLKFTHLLFYSDRKCQGKCIQENDCIRYGIKSKIYCYITNSTIHFGRQILEEQIRSNQILAYAIQSNPIIWWQYNELYFNNWCQFSPNFKNCSSKTLNQLNVSQQKINQINGRTQDIINGKSDPSLWLKERKTNRIIQKIGRTDYISFMNQTIVSLCNSIPTPIRECDIILRKPQRIVLKTFQKHSTYLNDDQYSYNTTNPQQTFQIKIQGQVFEEIQEISFSLRVTKASNFPLIQSYEVRQSNSLQFFIGTFGIFQKILDEDILYTSSSLDKNSQILVLKHSELKSSNLTITITYSDFKDYVFEIKVKKLNQFYTLNEWQEQFFHIYKNPVIIAFNITNITNKGFKYFRVFIKANFLMKEIGLFQNKELTISLTAQAYKSEYSFSQGTKILRFDQSSFKKYLNLKLIYAKIDKRIDDSKVKLSSFQVRFQSYFQDFIAPMFPMTITQLGNDRNKINSSIILSYDLGSFGSFTSKLPICGGLQVQKIGEQSLQIQFRQCVYEDINLCPSNFIENYSTFYKDQTKQIFTIKQLQRTKQKFMFGTNNSANQIQAHKGVNIRRYYAISKFNQTSSSYSQSSLGGLFTVAFHSQSEISFFNRLSSDVTSGGIYSKRFYISYRQYAWKSYNIYLTILNKDPSIRVYSRVYIKDQKIQTFFQQFTKIKHKNQQIQENYFILNIPADKDRVFIDIYVEDKLHRVPQLAISNLYSLSYSYVDNSKYGVKHIITEGAKTVLWAKSQSGDNSAFMIVLENKIGVFSFQKLSADMNSISLCIINQKDMSEICYNEDKVKLWGSLNGDEKIKGIKILSQNKILFKLRSKTGDALYQLFIKSFDNLIEFSQTTQIQNQKVVFIDQNKKSIQEQLKEKYNEQVSLPSKTSKIPEQIEKSIPQQSKQNEQVSVMSNGNNKSQKLNYQKGLNKSFFAGQMDNKSQFQNQNVVLKDGKSSIQEQPFKKMIQKLKQNSEKQITININNNLINQSPIQNNYDNQSQNRGMIKSSSGEIKQNSVQRSKLVQNSSSLVSSTSLHLIILIFLVVILIMLIMLGIYLCKLFQKMKYQSNTFMVSNNSNIEIESSNKAEVS